MDDEVQQTNCNNNEIDKITSHREVIEETTPEVKPAENTQIKPDDAPTPEPEAKRRGGRVNLNRGPLTEKEHCPDCNKLLSKHSLIYNTHKCAAKSKKTIIVENIEQPAAPIAAPEQTKAKRIASVPDPRPQMPRNYIDLDGDIDYSHLNVKKIINKYVMNLKENQRVQKQNKYKTLLSGRL
jgi:hypothetical protein